jgi:hypothetical protein
MGNNFVSDSTKQRMLNTMETVENSYPQDPRARSRRRVRTGGQGGATLKYIEITGSTDPNTYTATIYDNPVDRNSVEAGVTVKAIQHTNGTLPNSTAGKGFFATEVGGVLYIEPSVFYGE